MTDLPSNLSSLSLSEKLDLLDALWANVESQASISREDIDELDRRISAYRKNPAVAVPWEQVKAKHR